MVVPTLLYFLVVLVANLLAIGEGLGTRICTLAGRPSCSFEELFPFLFSVDSHGFQGRDFTLQYFVFFGQFSLLKQNFVRVLHCLIYQLHTLMRTIFLLFNTSNVFAQSLLRVFQLALKTFDILVFGNLVIRLSELNSTSQNLHFAVGTTFD